MSELHDRLSRLEAELDALRQMKTQEDFDEGARLHELHNAPWRKGLYSHLEFPPYRYQAFPKMLYSSTYEDACRAYDEALLIPARGSEDGERAKAILKAQRQKDAATKIVHSETEFRHACTTGWYESPTAAVEALRKADADIALAAAHRNYEDRNMGELAQREIAAADEAAEGHLAVIPETPKRPRTVRA